MRGLFWLLVIVLVAITVSLFAGHHDGYVLIVREPYRLELSFNLLLILIVLSFFILHFGLRFIAYARRLPSNVRKYREHQRQINGQAALQQSLHAIIDGRYQEAEKTAAHALDLGVDAGLSALIAARAAHRLQHKSRRDFYLAEAEHRAPEAASARLLTQAELLVDEKQYESALAVLAKLETFEPYHAPALRLSLHALRPLARWEQVLTNLSRLEKQAALEADKIREYRTEAHLQLIKQHAHQTNSLSSYWQSLTEEERLNPQVIYAVAQSFIYLGDSKQAVSLIQTSLAKSWDSALIKLLGQCSFDDPQAQLQQAELWLTSHEADANLLYTLGKLCQSLNVLPKAQTYFEASISVNASREAYIALAEMYEGRQEFETSIRYYKLSTTLVL